MPRSKTSPDANLKQTSARERQTKRALMYQRRGHKLVLLGKGSKKPKYAGWPELVPSKRDIQSWPGNIGLHLQGKYLVLDVDPRNGGVESIEKLFGQLDPLLENEPRPSVVTWSKGTHYYLSIPAEFSETNYKSTHPDYPGIDFLCAQAKANCYVLISGSIVEGKPYRWAKGFKNAFEFPECPETILKIFEAEPLSERTSRAEQSLEELCDSFEKPTSNEIVELLDQLDPSMAYDDWIKVGMALQSWDEAEGLSLWERWSINGFNYEKGATKKHWRSFGGRANGITLGTLKHMVEEATCTKEIELEQAMAEEIETAGKHELRFTIPKKIKNGDYSEEQLDRFVSMVQAREKKVSGHKPKVKDVRERLGLLVPERTRDPAEFEEKWQRWVYVISADRYLDLKNKMLNRPAGFNLTNGQYVLASQNGSKPTAVKFANDHNLIKKVDCLAYVPYKQAIFKRNGKTYANTYNHDSMPQPSEKYSREGKVAVKLVKRHINFICNQDKERAQILTQWLAYNIQFPGKLIGWAPIIKSIQGVGKSWFAELLRACLGYENVGVVNSQQVKEKFNGWATNSVVNVLEELRVKGQSRHDAANALKPLLTDPVIQINDKGISQYKTINVTNYICCTNYEDAIPLEEGDRRWWVIFVKAQDLSEVPARSGETHQDYFEALHRAVKEQGSQLYKWLSELEITPEFLALKQAPLTKEKEHLIQRERSKVNGLQEAEELLREGGEFFDDKVIVSSIFFANLEMDDWDLNLSTYDKGRIMQNLGYTNQKRMNVKGKKDRVNWKGESSEEEIKKYIQKKWK